MIRSVRARLALWYAGAFAILLGAFAVAGYLFLDYTSTARVDEYLAETASAVTGAIEFERHRNRTDEEAINSVVHEFRLRDSDVLVLDRANGQTLSSRLTLERDPAGARISAAPYVRNLQLVLHNAPRDPVARTIGSGDSGVRVFTLPYALGAHHLVVGVTRSLGSQQRMLREAELALAFGIPVILLLATFGGYVLARKSLQPVMEMSDRAAAIGASTLHERLPVRNPRDELGRLAAVFNELLGRLERSFEQQRLFMADASHELRTPVAVISAESEFALARDDRSGDELRDALRVVYGEGRRLSGIVDDLFLLARVDAGERPLRPESLYLRDLIEECARAARALASARRQEFLLRLDGDDMPLVGDEGLLKRLVTNLLDNAIKYSPEGGTVTVSAERTGGEYHVDVADTGSGVSAEERERIFDRFYRSESARSAVRTDGAGIGLAVAKWIARAHEGDVTLLESTERGSLFRIALPAPAAGDGRAN